MRDVQVARPLCFMAIQKGKRTDYEASGFAVRMIVPNGQKFAKRKKDQRQ